MQEKKKRSVFDIVVNIIIILLTILVVYWFIKLIFGGSPGLDEFNFAIIILLGGFLIKLYRGMGEVKVSIKHSFINIKEDMNSIKKKLKIR